jgi:serine/threonine protein kinase
MWRKSIQFKRLELLGEGGQGQVFKALRHDAQAKLSQTVALKILHSQTAVDLWRQEFESLSRVRSPFCVQVLSFERVGRRPALVLEFVDGVSLAQFGTTCLLDEDDLQELAAQLERALRDLHRQGIFHGDLSPQNVLLDREGRIRVLDFGLANCDQTKLRVTPQFASPERLLGARVDAAADLFSLGRVLEFLGARDCESYLHERPADREFQDLSPSSARQEALAKKVCAFLRRRELSASAQTRTQGPQRQKPWTAKRLVLATITYLLFLTTPHVSHSISPNKLGVLSVRTSRWHYFLLNGRPLGYAPFSIPLDADTNFRLEWISAEGRGEAVVAVKALETRVLEDRDFSH